MYNVSTNWSTLQVFFAFKGSLDNFSLIPHFFFFFFNVLGEHRLTTLLALELLKVLFYSVQKFFWLTVIFLIAYSRRHMCCPKEHSFFFFSFFLLSWNFYSIVQVYNDCMLDITCNFSSVTKIWVFLSVAIFKSINWLPLSWLLNLAPYTILQGCQLLRIVQEWETQKWLFCTRQIVQFWVTSKKKKKVMHAFFTCCVHWHSYMQEILHGSQLFTGEMFVIREILYAWRERGRNSVQVGDFLSMRESWQPWFILVCQSGGKFCACVCSF